MDPAESSPRAGQNSLKGARGRWMPCSLARFQRQFRAILVGQLSTGSLGDASPGAEKGNDEGPKLPYKCILSRAGRGFDTGEVPPFPRIKQHIRHVYIFFSHLTYCHGQARAREKGKTSLCRTNQKLPVQRIGACFSSGRQGTTDQGPRETWDGWGPETNVSCHAMELLWNCDVG